MTTQSDLVALSAKERREYGFARVRDAAFDAISALWARRQSEGMTQADIATAIDGDPGWVSKNLRGPGNWTLKTFGTFVEALDGEVQILVRAANDPLTLRSNYHAYVGYEPEAATIAVGRQGETRTMTVTLAQKGRGANAAILIP